MLTIRFIADTIGDGPDTKPNRSPRAAISASRRVRMVMLTHLMIRSWKSYRTSSHGQRSQEFLSPTENSLVDEENSHNIGKSTGRLGITCLSSGFWHGQTGVRRRNTEDRPSRIKKLYFLANSSTLSRLSRVALAPVGLQPYCQVPYAVSTRIRFTRRSPFLTYRDGVQELRH